MNHAIIDRVHSDVLVIGGGSAGTRAALEAARDCRVALLSKHVVGFSGITPLAFTGFAAFTGQNADDSLESQADDVLRAGHNLGDPDLVRAMVQAGKQAAHDLQHYGVCFVKSGDGLLLMAMPGNSHPRILRIIGEGASFMRALAQEVRKQPNVMLFPDTHATNLLCCEGRVAGVGALDARTGRFRVFTANAVVLAAGGCEQLWPHTDCPPESTGDGYAMALRAGAELVDLEQQLFYPTVTLYPGHLRGLEIPYERCLRVGGGGRLVNGLGEVFFEATTFPKRDELSRRVHREIAEGRATPHGGTYLDVTEAEDWLKEELPRTVAPFARLMHYGIDLRKQRVEVAPGVHTSLGGVRIDAQARTNVPGLFACGEAAGNVHGANRLPGHALLDTQAFGMIAGASAAAFALAHPTLDPNDSVLREEQGRVMALYSDSHGSVRPFVIANEIRQLMGRFVALERNRHGLETALSVLMKLRGRQQAELRVDGRPGFSVDWLEALECANMLEVAEAVVLSAMAREETRGIHVRSDCPWTENHPRHVIISRDTHGLHTRLEPVSSSGA